jgi:hypothetical protein
MDLYGLWQQPGVAPLTGCFTRGASGQSQRSTLVAAGADVPSISES